MARRPAQAGDGRLDAEGHEEEEGPDRGLADVLEAKSLRVGGERVGTVVARGDAEIGFQQVSELLPVEGIIYVGTIPNEVQTVTMFSAGITTGAKNVEATHALLEHLSSPVSAPVIAGTGMTPQSTGR